MNSSEHFFVLVVLNFLTLRKKKVKTEVFGFVFFAVVSTRLVLLLLFHLACEYSRPLMLPAALGTARDLTR